MSTHLPIAWWVIAEGTCPHHTECSALFEPPALFIQFCSKGVFISFPGWKSPQRETFCLCGRGETTEAEALKGIIIDEFKILNTKKCLDKCPASNREYFEGDDFWTCKNTQFFIYKLQAFGGPFHVSYMYYTLYSYSKVSNRKMLRKSWGRQNTFTVLIDKNLHKSEPMQFHPMFFKGWLYLLISVSPTSSSVRGRV